MKLLFTLPLLVAVAAVGQQQAPVLTPRTGVPTLRASARAVRLDVVVTDKHGHAVHGLKADDFNVVEDDQPQTIQAFEEIRPAAVDLTPAKLPMNTFTNAAKVKPSGAMTVLFLDGLDTQLQYQAFARSELLKYLEHAQIEGPIAIFALDTQLRLIQGFTTDLEVLRRAVKERDQLIMTVYGQGEGGYVRARFKTDILTHALRDLGKYLAEFPGRKNLMWFTGSVPTYSFDDGTYLGGALRDSESLVADYQKATQILQLGQVSVYPIDAEGLRTNPAFSAAQSRAPSIGQISGFGTGQEIKHEDLEDVAEATGGRAFYNTNGIHQAIAEVVESGSNYYTVLYTPTNRFWDGKYRRLKVSVDVPNTRLEYRRGYYAATDVGPAPGANGPKQSPGSSARRQLTSHDPDPFAKAMQLGAIDPGTLVFEAHIDAAGGVEQTAKGAALPKDNYLEPKYQNKPYRTLRVNYSVPAKQLQIAPLPSGVLQGSVEFVAVVIDEKGNLVNSEQGTVEMALKPETYARLLSTGGLHFPMDIAVPVKGSYFLRTGVRDIPSGHAGALELSTGDLQLVP